jgi:hypothetical protein
MQRNVRNIGMILVLLIILLSISACATSSGSGVGGEFITGKSWQHPDKSIQEQEQDLAYCRSECQKSMSAKGYTGDFAIFRSRDCEDECMLNKGYTWR